MTDPYTGCPERALEPPENLDPPDSYDWDDEIYQLYVDRRYENEFVRADRRVAERNGKHRD